MRKSIVALAVILMVMLSSCGDTHTDYSKIYESYGNIKTYSADIKVTVNPGSEASSYTAKQFYSAPDLYRLDYTSEGMDNVSCVLKGDKLYFKGPDDKITEFSGYVPSEKYYIFITDFMERYCKSEEAKNSQKGSETVLELKENGTDPQKAAMKLFVKNKTGEPKKLVTYNQNGDEIIIVEYENFKMNPTFNKGLFDL